MEEKTQGSAKKQLNRVVIVGAGISGLYAAYKMLQKDFEVYVIERQNFVGGLSASIKYDGYIMDIGPHYISLPWNSRVTDEIVNLLPREDIIKLSNVKHLHKVYYKGKIRDNYPSILQVAMGNGFSSFFNTIVTLFVGKIKKSFSSRNLSTREYFQLEYGSYLYRNWFDPLYRKLYAGEEIPLTLATKKFPPLNLKKIAKFLFNNSSKNDLTRKKRNQNSSTDSFNFYLKQGIGELTDELSQKVQTIGGNLWLGTEINHISRDATKKVSLSYQNKSYELEADIVIYAVPPSVVLNFFPNHNIHQNSKKDMFNSIMLFLFVDSPELFKGWTVNCYDKDLIFTRLSQQNYLSSQVVPPGKTLLNVEIKLREHDSVWNLDDESIFARVIKDLEKTGLLKANDVEGYRIYRFRNLYPVPKQERDTTEDEFQSKVFEEIAKYDNEFLITAGFDEGELASDAQVDIDTKGGRGGIYRALTNVERIISKMT